MSESTQLNLYQKLAKIRALSDVAKKNKKGYNYTYTDITEILAHVTAGMKKYGVSLIPSIVPATADVSQNVLVNTKFDKTGKSYEQTTTEMLFKADMLFRWVNDDKPTEIIEVPWFITGSMSDCAQAMGAGLTYTLRQFLTSYFQIAQADTDVDAYRSKQKSVAESEDKAIAAEIINQVDELVKSIIEKNPKLTDEVKKFIGKYAKNSNYLAIQNPELASKLLNDLYQQYGSEGE